MSLVIIKIIGELIMASAAKHMKRSHKSYYKQRAGKFWFFNHCAYQAWLSNRTKEFNTIPSVVPAETEPEVEIVED